MKKLCLFCCVLSLICPLTDIGQKKVKGCTIGVASGKATANGQPRLWKNADGSYEPKEVVYFKDGRFKYPAAVPAHDSWISAGINEFGLCVVHAGAFNLPEDLKREIIPTPASMPLTLKWHPWAMSSGSISPLPEAKIREEQN